MTNFERAKLMIDAMMPIADLHERDATAEESVKRRLQMLTEEYGGRLLNSGRNPIDYSKITTHIAYTYRSLPAHSDWMYKALTHARKSVLAKMTGKKVRVACIGGGPGSDMLGVLKFANENSLNDKKFAFAVLDREKAWNGCRRHLVDTFEGELSVSQKHINLDLANGSPWTTNWGWLDADIFTFSFVLSEVWSFNEKRSVSEFIDRVIGGAGEGAIFCYVDNGGDNFIPLMEAEFDNRPDLRRIFSRDFSRLLMSYEEQSSAVEATYGTIFGQSPKLKGNVSMRVWKKI
ncbi:hypothetical protein [Sphingorhabdus sp.]|jgi:hypothetical protein|uniref:hypothetical protein n=1 Tax=Sphingorhabdus sp. TaxID=1902408 RepID=UPI0037C90D87